MQSARAAAGLMTLIEQLAALGAVHGLAGNEFLTAAIAIVRLTDGHADTNDLLEWIITGSAAGLLQTLRSAESADPDCTRFPRFGAHDDATLVWAQV
ncbi:MULTISPECIES: hypothetical protein [unclassified Pseudofrankia]|uniref:hypothetical protein n=1 Tax=unclassified Pseudofrankia TaxID=2994372 RepID=UPI0010423E51|nr:MULTISPECIES: hypothetical protein [unclassified Pseudofrankia]MDT3445252.1 hypothetical protein [Pseudofrankia sp. BMG5.37]